MVDRPSDSPDADDGDPADDPSGAIAAELAAEVDTPLGSPSAGEGDEGAPQAAALPAQDSTAVVDPALAATAAMPHVPTPTGTAAAEDTLVALAAAEGARAPDGAGSLATGSAPAAGAAVEEPVVAASPAPAAEVRRRDARPPPRVLVAMIVVAALPTVVTLLLLALGAPGAALATLAGRDAYEPNDSLVGAPRLAAGVRVVGLTCGPGDVDWFQLDPPPAGQALVIEVTPAAEGHGGTSVHAATGVVVAASRTVQDVERAVVVAGAPGPLFVRVWGAREPYAIVARVVDLAHRFEPNDEAAQAARVEPGPTLLGVEGSGEDWFAVPVPALRPLVARLANAAPGLSLEVGTAHAAADLASVTSAREAQAAAVAASRTVLLRVRGVGRYDLQLELGPAQAGRRRRGRPTLEEIHGTFEPNDSQEQAQPIGPGRYPDLRCSGEDWFLVDVPTGRPVVLSATTTFSASRGDLELELRAPGGARLSSSTGSGDSEHCQATLPDGGPIFVHVYNALNPYTLAVNVAEDDDPDPLEAGDYDGLVCSGNDVWSVRVPAGQVLSAVATWAPRDGQLSVELLDLNRSGLAASTSTGGGTTTTTTPALPVEQAVLVRVCGSPIAYGLSLRVEPPSASQGQGRVVQAPGGAFTPSGPSRRVGPGVYTGQVIGDEQWYVLDVDEGQRVGFDLAFRNAQGDIDCDLLDAGGVTVGSSNSTSDRETIAYTSPRTQPMYLRVHSLGGRNVCTLTLSLNGSAAAERLQPGEHPGLTCEGAVQYLIDVPAGKRLAATIGFVHARGDLDLLLMDDAGGVVARSESLEDREHAEWTAPVDTTVTVRVHNARNTFDLSLTIE